mmetsp:Transcript_52172/g.114351  ORF Transcript_52172/g.114351 Transcript_52172/m.114351 type:complete len:146 (+) Transcript_52172:1-438(+)
MPIGRASKATAMAVVSGARAAAALVGAGATVVYTYVLAPIGSAARAGVAILANGARKAGTAVYVIILRPGAEAVRVVAAELAKVSGQVCAAVSAVGSRVVQVLRTTAGEVLAGARTAGAACRQSVGDLSEALLSVRNVFRGSASA